VINDAVRGYFGFERLPFDRSIPVGALFASASHQEAVGRIAYGIDTRQITVITGEVGAGKSVAARAAVARLDASRYQLIAIPNPQVGARGIHHAVVAALGGVPRVHHATLIPQAAGHLAAELAERGRLPVLLIDLCRFRAYADAGCRCPAGRLFRGASASGGYRHSSAAVLVLLSERAWCPPGGGARWERSRGRGCRVRWRRSRTGSGLSWIGWATGRIRGSSRSTRCRG
jgi:hypothetical protein